MGLVASMTGLHAVTRNGPRLHFFFGLSAKTHKVICVDLSASEGNPALVRVQLVVGKCVCVCVCGGLSTVGYGDESKLNTGFVRYKNIGDFFFASPKN